jgi:hypothetical protein
VVDVGRLTPVVGETGVTTEGVLAGKTPAKNAAGLKTVACPGETHPNDCSETIGFAGDL